MQSRVRLQTLIGFTLVPIALMALSGAGELRWRQAKSLFIPDKSTKATLRLSGFKQSSEDYTPEDNINSVLGRYRNESLELEVGYTLALMQRADQSAAGVQRLAEVGKRRGYTKRLCAHILRHAMQNDPLESRREVYEMRGSTVSHKSSVSPLYPMPMEAYEAVVQGEKLDPENAFFPLMRAIFIFSMPHESDPAVDEQALQAIRTATQKSRYEDYLWNEAELVNQVYTRAYGKQSAIQVAALHEVVRAPHYLPISDLARILAYKAILSEGKGDYKQGIAYRRGILRFGRLLQNSPSHLASLTGSSVIAMALQPRVPPKKGGTSASANRAKTVAFLQKHGEAGLAQWIADNQQIVQNNSNDLTMNEVVSRLVGVKNSDYYAEFYWWLTDTLLWAAIFNLILLACIALYFRRNSAENRWTVIGSVAVLLIANVFWQPHLHSITNLKEITHSLAISVESSRMDRFWDWEPTQFMAVIWALGWALPLLLTLFCGGYSLLRKQPLTKSLTSACLVGAMTLLWVIAFSPTPQIETNMRREMARYTLSEGRFLAAKAGQKWMNAPLVP
ncbi:MAG: hypothetical protein NT023_16715 [Armatimonadetes bacterium]|nr:hypothetical protein [Armatimonadota bacterium]